MVRSRGSPPGHGGRRGSIQRFALSPDERRVAISVESPSSRNHDIWIMDIASVTCPPESHSIPQTIYRQCGPQTARRLHSKAERSGKMTLRQRLVSGTGTEEPASEALGTRSRPCESRQCTIVPSAWSTDGRYIAYTLSGGFPRTADVWIFRCSAIGNHFRWRKPSSWRGRPRSLPMVGGFCTRPMSPAGRMSTFNHFSEPAENIPVSRDEA